MIKHEVIQRIVASPGNYLHYTFFIDRVMIALRPQRASSYHKVYLSPRVDDGAFTFTDLARSLPETVYSAKTLGHKILETHELSDIRELIASQLFRWYKCSSDDKRRILLNLKSDINTTDFFKKSTDLVAGKNKRVIRSMEFHLMSLEDLLNLFPGDSDDDDDAKARAELLTLCI